VIVNDLHFVGIALPPFETDAPSLIDANAPLSLPVATQSLQPIPWRYLQVVEGIRCVDLHELPQGHAMQGCRHNPAPLAPEQLLGLVVLEAPDHADSITEYVINVKRYILEAEA
jgi:hypothetical protein